MKRMNLLAKAGLLFAAGATLLFAGCDNGNDEDGGDNGSKKLQLTVNLTAPAGYEASELPSMTVTAVNSDKELTYTETTAAGATSVTFEVSSGQYQITATGRYSNTISFTGAVTADVFGDKTAAVALSEVNKSPLVFKEVYSTSVNWKLNDTYMEIVNNSDEVQYLDQVIIGAMLTLSKPNPWVDASGKQLDKYPLYGIVAAFPGTGKEHPLQPGESVVIANDATDWSADGAANLTNADWECYIPDAGQADADYDAPNLEIVYNLENQRRLGAGFFGGGLVMAKLPEGMTPSQFAADSENFMTEPNKVDATQLHFMIPSKYLLDAVEMFDADDSDRYHTLLAQDDAGSALVNGWSGKSIRRKVTKVENGRAYYQDTNNSTDDFLTGQPLTPGVHPTQAD